MPKVTAMDMLKVTKGEGDDLCLSFSLLRYAIGLAITEPGSLGEQSGRLKSGPSCGFDAPGAGRALQVMLRQLEILRLSLCGCPSHPF